VLKVPLNHNQISLNVGHVMSNHTMLVSCFLFIVERCALKLMYFLFFVVDGLEP